MLYFVRNNQPVKNTSYVSNGTRIGTDWKKLQKRMVLVNEDAVARFDVCADNESAIVTALLGMKNTNKKCGIPKLADINKIFASEESTIDFLLEEGIVKPPTVCPRCESALNPPRCDMVRCNRCVSIHGSAWSQSIFKGTFFQGCKKGRREIMIFLYHWLCGASDRQLALYTGWSKGKVSSWVRYVHELVCSMVMADERQIGGDGIVVEIDESKFGKRKHHRGHRVEGAWVFGGVENTPERRFFAVYVEDRKAVTLLPLIKRFIAPGSIIRSDCFPSYNGIQDLEIDAGYGYTLPLYEHEAVNHSEHFIDENGVHTNTIEGTWYAVKRMTPVRKRNRKQIQGSLFEFIWRRDNEGNLWNGLMAALRDVQYD